MELENGAAAPGDYLYRSGSLRWDVESGLWGILRIMKRAISTVVKMPAFVWCKLLNLACNVRSIYQNR